MPQTINNMVQEWTNSLTTYTAIKMNIPTDVSAAGSLLMDLQVGGTSQFNVSKAGMISVPGNGGLTANGNISIRSSVGASIIFQGATNDFLALQASSSTVGLRSTGTLGWTSSANSGNGVPDTIFTRRGVANLRLGAADTGAVTSTVTITIAAPGVVTWTNHTFSTGTPVVFTTTGALPTGITAGTTYYAVVVDANTFQIASSVANAIAATPTVITTSGTQSGTHTGTRYNITQRLGMQGITGVADRLGADLIIQGSQGTGDKAGGSIIFQVAPAVSSGTAQNALVDALTIGGNRVVTLAGTRLATSGVSLDFTISGLPVVGVGLQFLGLNQNSHIRWSSSTTDPNGGTTELALHRDAANTLALRNGANAQTFRVYNTYTSDTNYESGRLQWVGNEFRIGPETVGGTLRSMGLYVGGTRYQIIGSNFNQFDQNIYMNAANIVTDTSTGFKIGTGTTQKIGFWNATPIAQPTTAVAAATVAATGTGDVVAASTTFDGYTIPQIVKALRNAGLLA